MSLVRSFRSSLCVGLCELLVLAVSMLRTVDGNKTVTYVPDLDDPKVQQRIRIFSALRSCMADLQNVTAPTDGGLYCEPVWDQLMCWPEFVPANTVVFRRCPAYIRGFNSKENALRRCTENGTWEVHPDPTIEGHYTDFSNCRNPDIPSIILEHVPIVNRISTIGYALSLFTLCLAMAIMLYFKKLHCSRNTIHINLFASFCLRAVTSLIRNCLLVGGFALPSDITYDSDGAIVFDPTAAHWECKLLNSLWIYALLANYFWIFVEGLYLHTLIFFDVFSPSKRFFKLYFIIGWALPLVFIVAWILARIFFYNALCWNIHSKGFLWIWEAPIVLTICINFFFFINIIRELFTKIRNCNTRDPKRYRKFAKSTLVLIPMFGVYYIIFIVLNRIQHPYVSVICLYLELPLNSIQGAAVAMLFCFLNGEVQAEIMRRWDRHRLRSRSLIPSRSSRAFSTASSFLGRDRTSICMGTVSSHPAHAGDSGGNGYAVRTSDGDTVSDGADKSPGVHYLNKSTLIVPYTVTPERLQEFSSSDPASPEVICKDNNLFSSAQLSPLSETREETMFQNSINDHDSNQHKQQECPFSQGNPLNSHSQGGSNVLIPLEKDTRLSCPTERSESASTGYCSSPREGEYRTSKGNNQETTSLLPAHSSVGGLPPSPDPETTDETRPILN